MNCGKLLFLLVGIALVSTAFIAFGFHPLKLDIPFIQPKPANAASLPTQGLFEDCSVDTGKVCLQRLSTMSSGGFTLAINYAEFFGTADQVLAYADKARLKNMRLLWNFSDTGFWDGTNLLTKYADIAASCNCHDNDGFIRYVVNLVKNHPATWGYFVGDEVEPTTDNHTRMKAFSDLIHTLDPNHQRFYIADYIPDDCLQRLRLFTDTAEVIGLDIYPLSDNRPITDITTCAKELKKHAKQNNKLYWMAVQAFDGATYGANPGWPGKKYMRQEKDLVIQNSSPVALFWFSFHDAIKIPSHWGDLIYAANAKRF